MSSKVASGKGGKKKELSSSSSSSGSESDSDDERTTKKTVTAKPAAKKQPAKKGKQSESESSSSSSSSSSSESDSDSDKKKKKPAAAAKKPAAKKNAKKKDVSSSESDSDSDADAKKKKPAAGKKAAAAPEKKKVEPAKPANAFAGLGDEDDEDSQSESEDEKPQAKKKASSVEPSEDESEKNAKGKGKGGKAAAKGKAAKPADDDDLDDILNDLSIAPKKGGDDKDGAAEGEAGMSKAQLKRLRQKQKQEAEKNAPAEAAAPAAAAAAAPAADAKKKDEKKKEAPAAAKGNKAVEALKEKLRIQKEEEEKRRKDEEDRLAAIEAERIRLEEEAKREAEEKAARQAARAKARDQARAEGKLLSKTEKAALAKRQAFLKQLEASGQMLPAALLEQRKKDEAALAAAGGAGDEAGEASASPEAAPAGGDAGEKKEKVSKKDQRSKGKSAFGKRMEAQKEAEKIRAERYANEDAARKAVKEEEERRKAEDAALVAKAQAALEAVDKEEKEVEDTPVDVEEEEEQDDEPVADSWEELDSEEERRKETEKEARRAAKSAEKAAAIKAKEDKLTALQKKKDDIIKARDAEAAELKKKRQAADEVRKKKDEEERKKKEEAERQAKAVEQGFEMERESKPEESAAQSSSSGKESKRKGELRSPIGCILGHVDTGKCWGLGTKLMLFDGTSIKVEDLVAASEQGNLIQLMGDDNTPRTVQPGSAIRGNTGAEAAQFDPTPKLELLPLRFSWREGDRGTNGFVCKYHGCNTEVHSLSALRTHMSDDSLHTALLPPIEPGMYRITSAHQGRDSWTCNADHILVVVFTRPPTDVRRHQRQQEHNLPWHFTSLEARFDRKKGNLVVEQDYSFSTESEAETARAAYMKTWQPLVWEGSVAHYLRSEPSVQKLGRMYQPANVQFELEGESLNARLSNILGVAASEQQVLETATLIGKWIANGVEADSVLTSLLQSYRMMGNKRLPRELSTESREVRMALLSGMIEASSEVVAQQRSTLDGYIHLARGLGFCTGKPSLAADNWRVTINEQSSKRSDEWSQRSAEFTVQKIAHDNYYGFTVDGNGRFLMDDFVVTHNTKILDKIRQSNVQSHEAGGITQQIGCTWMPRQKILEKTAELCEFTKKELKMDVPGLLMVDTPGHESFTNLRSRGSNLCDIAILVVDIMHGLEPQTIESINLLKQRKTPFIIALNKIDRCYGWKTTPDCPLLKTLANQSDSTRGEFEKRMKEAMLLLSQQGLNTVPYYENPDFRKYISIVPTSAITGEGIPDLLMLLVTLTQQMMNERLTFNNELKCTVLDVKVIEGLGTTIDVILVNGTLEEGQTIVVCGLNGPIVTTVRALLTPPPMHEMRVKADYVHHKVIKAAMGVKISAQGLEQAVAGTSLMVCGKKDDIEELKDEVQSDLATILSKVDKSGQGVAVQASTLGSLEALLSFLEDMKIPVSCINIGPVYKKDIMKAAVMLERRPEYGVLLAFDVKVAPDAQKLADEMGVKIFTADIIYHLFDSCTKYMDEVKAKKRAESAEVAVFPVVLDILPNAIFNVKSPIVLGVRVTEGVARLGTPICIPSKNFLYIGKITGIQKNHVDFTEAKKGEEFALKLEQSKSDQQIVFGRQFDASSQLVSRITRESIDLLKANFKDDVSEAEWKLIIKLKKIFDIL